eukprot:3941731-Rhodomonas_salina.1
MGGRGGEADEDGGSSGVDSGLGGPAVPFQGGHALPVLLYPESSKLLYPKHAMLRSRSTRNCAKTPRASSAKSLLWRFCAVFGCAVCGCVWMRVDGGVWRQRQAKRRRARCSRAPTAARPQTAGVLNARVSVCVGFGSRVCACVDGARRESGADEDGDGAAAGSSVRSTAAAAATAATAATTAATAAAAAEAAAAAALDDAAAEQHEGGDAEARHAAAAAAAHSERTPRARIEERAAGCTRCGARRRDRRKEEEGGRRREEGGWSGAV